MTTLNDKSSGDTTVLFVDLDDFKDVNDMLGHGAGDELLREVAARLSRATRPGDLCARLGGDEFAVLLPGTSTPAGSEVARRIVTAVGAAVQIGDRAARVGVSIGVATATSGTDLAALIHRADVAMYAAKAGGKAQIQLFEPGLLQVNSSLTVFERHLAAAAGNGELVVHYQPVLGLPDGRCTAVEALVRWQHPERGLLYPESFIAPAERIGAIGDVGAFVLRQTCADSAVWRSAHPDSPMACHINISGVQLDDHSFIDTVTRCLSDFSLPPDQLVLEINETRAILSPLAIDRLNTLAAHGVTIAIDDFGTGCSAFATLRTLRAKIVKIDKSLVAGCTERPQDRAVFEALVKMAAQIGMRTIAAGVETLEQHEFVKSVQTDAAQGYLYLKPTAAREFGEWLGSNLNGRSPTRPVGDVVLPFKPRRTA